jgi:hypothetical protein
LTSGSNTIASSAVAASFNGSPYNSCTSTDMYSSFGCDLGGYPIATPTDGMAWPSGSQTDPINFQITAAGLAVGTYTGTVNLTVTAS